MADRDIRITVKGLDEGGKKLLKDVNKELKETPASSKKASRGLRSLKVAWGQVLGVIGTVTAAIYAGKKAYDFAKEGAELELVEDRFYRLAKSIGTTGDALMDELGPAMGGMLSDAEMMKSVTDLMALGLVKNQEEAIRLARVSGQLNMDMNQLVLTLTNMTTMRFDALGVSVDGFNDKVKELEDAGMSANEAFQEAFLQQGEEQVEKMGSTVDSAAGEFKIFEANMKNTWDEMKKGAKDALLPTIKRMNELTDIEERYQLALEEGIVTRSDLKDETFAWVDAQGDAYISDWQSVKAIEYLEQAIIDYLVEQQLSIAALEDQISVAESADKVMLSYATSVGDAGEETDNLRMSMEDLKIFMAGDMDVTMEDFKESQEELRIKSSDLRAEIEKLERQPITSDEQIEEINSLKEELKENEEQILRNKEAYSETTAQFLFDVLARRIAQEEMGAAGDKILMEMATNMGLIDQATKDTWDTMDAWLSDAMTDGKVTNDELENLESTLLRMDGMQAYQDIWVTTHHDIISQVPTIELPEMPGPTLPPVGPGSRPGGPGDIGFATGGQFIVPPGFPNDSFPMRVQSGERVTVETPAQISRGDVYIDNITLNNGMDVMQFKAMLRSAIYG